MNKSYKILTLVVLCVFVFAMSTCFATGISSADADETSGEVNYINNYEDYEQLVNDTTSSYTQEDLKDYYVEYQGYMKEYYSGYNRTETVRARVISAENAEERYELDEYYYSVIKYEIQPISVEVLEGEYAGQKFNIDYVLTGDSLNNITYSTLQKGDVIFVAINEDGETGEIYADVTNAGSNIERFGVFVCIGIIAILLVVIYGGKKGLIASLISLMIADFCLIIIPNMGYMGAGFIVGGIILILLSILTITLMEFGNTKKAFKAMGISVIIPIVALIFVLISNYLTRTVGITFEAAAVSENVLMGNINFETLYLLITMIITTFVSTNIVCKTINKIDEKASGTFEEKLAACKSFLGKDIIMIVGIILALYIPNHLLLLTNKYTSVEIWNSEILISELVRMFVIVASMALAIPTTIALYRKEEK